MKLVSKRSFVIVVIYLVSALVAELTTATPLLVDDLLAVPQVDEVVAVPARESNRTSDLLTRIRRDFGIGSAHHGRRHQCQPESHSPHLHRRSICPFEIQRDVNPLRIPDVIHRSHCLCESSPCSQQSQPGSHPPARCVSLVSPLKVAYLDQNLSSVVSTEVIHVPVACVCATQPQGRHMPQNRNIVV